MPPTFTLNQTTGLLTPAHFIRSPNCDDRPRIDDITVLVIHAISLPPGCYGDDYIAQLFTNCLPADAHPYFADIACMKVSAHFLIRRDGALIQFVPTHLRAWHAGVSDFNGRENVNDFSIGIELEGCDQHPFDPPQYQTLTRLIKALRTAYPIPLDHIVGHNQIAPTRKTDPGPHFDWQHLRTALSQN